MKVSGVGIPDRALKTVILADRRNGRGLERKAVDIQSEQIAGNPFHHCPAMVAVEFPPSHGAIRQRHPQDQLGQRIELDRPGFQACDRQHVQRLVEAAIDYSGTRRNDHFVERQPDYAGTASCQNLPPGGVPFRVVLQWHPK